MRLTALITGASTTITIPREPPNGEEWKSLRVLKAFHNVNTGTAATNKVFFISIDECDNPAFCTSTGGSIINYSHAYILGHDATTDEIRLDSNTLPIKFRGNAKTQKLTINVENIAGAAAPGGDLSATYYIILELDLDCGKNRDY
jgi:hypothetical protein